MFSPFLTSCEKMDILMKKCFLVLGMIFFCGKTIFAGEIKSMFMSEVDMSKLIISSKSRTMEDVDKDFGISTVGYEKLECNGPCITTVVVINSDGCLRYVEENDGDKKYTLKTGTISKSAVYLLHEYITEIGYFDLDSFYAISATDLNPPRIFMVKRNGNSKYVVNYGNAAPNKIWALEMLIEHFVLITKWEN